MNPNLVSVVIPVYNGEAYIEEAVDSALNQTYNNIEIIVVNDGSTDSTIQKITKYNFQIKIISKPNGGVASALNKGIEVANGKFIAWLSHDDLFFPEKISEQILFFENYPEFIACYTDFMIIDSVGNPIKTIDTPWYPSLELPNQFLKNMYVNGSTTMLRKKSLDAVGLFNGNLLHTQDMDMWLRLSKVGEIGRVDKVLLKSRSHLMQGSLNFEKQISEEQDYLTQLIQNNSIHYFFPYLKIEKVGNVNQIDALKYKLLAKTIYKHRKWKKFALQQIQLSEKYQPSISSKIQKIIYNTDQYLFGDEFDILLYKKKAVMLLGFGNNAETRRLSLQFLRKHPLRLDVFIIFLKSLVPVSTYKLIRKKIKGR